MPFFTITVASLHPLIIDFTHFIKNLLRKLSSVAEDRGQSEIMRELLHLPLAHESAALKVVEHALAGLTVPPLCRSALFPWNYVICRPAEQVSL